MRLLLLAVGSRQPDWVNNGFNEYSRRFPPHLTFHLQEIAAAKRSKNTATDRIKQEEGERLLKALPHDALVVALDEHGKTVSTRGLADKLADWQHTGRDIVFLIGGADGLAADCLQRTDWHWSLSPLTLPHGLVRIMVAEQLYRAHSLLEGHPYHRE